MKTKIEKLDELIQTVNQLLKRIEALEKWKTGKDKAYPNSGD